MNRVGARHWAVAALSALPLLAPAPLAAQTVRGQVLDTATSQPVPQATVLLLRDEAKDSTVAARGVTDGQGRFALQAPESGPYRLRCMVIGYQPVTTPAFDLRVGEKPLEVEVRISQVAVVLAPLTIVSQRPARLPDSWLTMEGYYDRAHRYGREGLGVGRFLDRAAIEQSTPYDVSDIVRMMPGVQVVGTGGRRQVITFKRAAAGGRCVPTVFINGSPVASGADVNEVVLPYELSAMEVYPGPIIPGEYLEPGVEMCGAIVLWTGYDRNHLAKAPTAPPARRLGLHLALPADTVKPRDSVPASLSLSNLSDTARTVCITGSHYTTSGSGGSRDLDLNLSRQGCFELPARASVRWQEEVTLTKRDGPGPLLLQKRLDLRLTPCEDGPRCERSLGSNWRTLVVRPR